MHGSNKLPVTYGQDLPLPAIRVVSLNKLKHDDAKLDKHIAKIGLDRVFASLDWLTPPATCKAFGN
jgi:hypothetical protein